MMKMRGQTTPECTNGFIIIFWMYRSLFRRSYSVSRYNLDCKVHRGFSSRIVYFSPPHSHTWVLLPKHGAISNTFGMERTHHANCRRLRLRYASLTKTSMLKTWQYWYLVKAGLYHHTGLCSGLGYDSWSYSNLNLSVFIDRAASGVLLKWSSSFFFPCV